MTLGFTVGGNDGEQSQGGGGLGGNSGLRRVGGCSACRTGSPGCAGQGMALGAAGDICLPWGTSAEKPEVTGPERAWSSPVAPSP